MFEIPSQKPLQNSQLRKYVKSPKLPSLMHLTLGMKGLKTQ